MREEEKKRSSQDSKIKRFMKKRWVYPAIYIASAAIILTAVLWFQNSNNSATDKEQIDYEATDLTGKQFEEDALEVNRAMENFAMPVKDPDSVVIQKQFYEFDGTEEEQEAALVSYNNSYHPNTGIDITMENGETFEVVAALSGKVINVLNDSLLGNVIEIEHDKGIVTQYQSVTDIGVKVNDQVEQGQALAKAGKSLYNEDAGTHLHFEIRKDGVAVNPIDYFNKPLSALQEANVTESEKTDAKENDSTGATEEDEATEEDKAASDEDKSTEEDKKAPSDEDNATPEEDKEKNSDDTKEDDTPANEEDAEQTDSTDA